MCKFKDGDRVVCIKAWCELDEAVGVPGYVVMDDGRLGVVFDTFVGGHTLCYPSRSPEGREIFGRGWWFPTESADEYLALDETQQDCASLSFEGLF